VASRDGSTLPESSGPTITCHSRPSTPDPLTCSAAVAAVRSALGSRAANVTSYDFAYGFYCPPGQYCKVPIPANGFVIVTFTNDATVVAIVKAADDGSVDILYIEAKSQLDG
jgi:hypothetical protein